MRQCLLGASIAVAAVSGYASSSDPDDGTRQPEIEAHEPRTPSVEFQRPLAEPRQPNVEARRPLMDFRRPNVEPRRPAIDRGPVIQSRNRP